MEGFAFERSCPTSSEAVFHKFYVSLRIHDVRSEAVREPLLQLSQQMLTNADGTGERRGNDGR
jgi:hypothetical protein